MLCSAVAAVWQWSVLLYVEGEGPLPRIAAVAGMGGTAQRERPLLLCSSGSAVVRWCGSCHVALVKMVME